MKLEPLPEKDGVRKDQTVRYGLHWRKLLPRIGQIKADDNILINYLLMTFLKLVLPRPHTSFPPSTPRLFFPSDSPAPASQPEPIILCQEHTSDWRERELPAIQTKPAKKQPRRASTPALRSKRPERPAPVETKDHLHSSTWRACELPNQRNNTCYTCSATRHWRLYINYLQRLTLIGEQNKERNFCSFV